VLFNQIEFSLVQHEAMTNGSLDHMMTHGIVPMCWSPLGGVFSEHTERNERILAVLEELCGWYDAQPDQLLLSWIMKHPAGILPVIGTTSPRRMQLSIDAAKIELSETDWFKLWVASRGTKVP
jgi:predicted oxidoreductase